MEVLVGPTFSIEVSSPQDNHLHASSAAAAAAAPTPNCIFLKDEAEIVDQHPDNLISRRIGSGIRVNDLDDDDENDNSTDSSSSIGAPDDSEEEEEDEVDSGSSSKGALGSLNSLEDSLPTKRGLSNHFAGKSKSFTNLSQVVNCETSTVKDLVKPENPFNKRRRILMANKYWSNRRKSSSFYAWSNPKSMPLLALPEEEEDDQHHHQEDEEENNNQESPFPSSPEQENYHHHHRLLHQQLRRFSKLQNRKFNASFKSHSCLSLTDLQEEDEQYQ